MKKMKKLVIPLIGLLLLSSCIQNNGNASQNTPTLPEMQLSFMGFDLGSKLDSCLATVQLNDKKFKFKQEKKNNDRVQNISFGIDIPDFLSTESQIHLEVEISAFDNIIYGIQLTSRDESSKGSIPAMYIAKYGARDPEGYANKTWTWNYANAILEIKNVTRTESHKEIIPERAHLKLNNIENYFRTVTKTYFVEEIVTYSDILTSDRLSAYLTRKKEIDDSLRYEETVREITAKREAQNIAEKERQNIQNKIVNNLQY